MSVVQRPHPRAPGTAHAFANSEFGGRPRDIAPMPTLGWASVDASSEFAGRHRAISDQQAADLALGVAEPRKSGDSGAHSDQDSAPRAPSGRMHMTCSCDGAPDSGLPPIIVQPAESVQDARPRGASQARLSLIWAGSRADSAPIWPSYQIVGTALAETG
jgi:hypothetical protein